LSGEEAFSFSLTPHRSFMMDIHRLPDEEFFHGSSLKTKEFFIMESEVMVWSFIHESIWSLLSTGIAFMNEETRI
jgi:hypothetical protein